MRYGDRMHTCNAKNKEYGFSALEALIVILVIALIAGAGLFISKRNATDKTTSNQNTTQQSSGDQDDSTLLIKNFGLDSLSSVDVTTQATRDFTQSGHKGFYIFGDILPGTPVRHNPNFEFASLKEDTKIVAAIDGVIGFIKQQEGSGDYEVFLMPNEKSDWVIGYDHVIDLKVSKGDTVKAGDTLGAPARQNNGLLRFEFQINNNGRSATHICPSTLLDPSVKDSLLQQLGDIQDQWETVSGLELYDVTKQDPIGCLSKDMTPAYAEGRS